MGTWVSDLFPPEDPTPQSVSSADTRAATRLQLGPTSPPSHCERVSFAPGETQQHSTATYCIPPRPAGESSVKH